MEKVKPNPSVASSSEGKDSMETSKDLKGIKKLKTLEFSHSDDFVCDINTGICSPINQEKEGKK